MKFKTAKVMFCTFWGEIVCMHSGLSGPTFEASCEMICIWHPLSCDMGLDGTL